MLAPGRAELLRNPHPSGQVCTQLFGGPETAVVRGTVGSTQVHATLGRADGCETAAWEQLKPLLQP